MRHVSLGLLATFTVAISLVAQTPARMKVMLLDGESGGPYHRWQVSTPLIERALPPAPSEAFEWSEAMNWELHLAAIDGEQIPESGRSEHLQKAGIACHRAGNGGCDLEQLREAARALLR